jgi:hypothetical protein
MVRRRSYAAQLAQTHERTSGHIIDSPPGGFQFRVTESGAAAESA